MAFWKGFRTSRITRCLAISALPVPLLGLGYFAADPDVFMNLQMMFMGESSTHVRQIASPGDVRRGPIVPRDARFLFMSQGKGPRADQYHEVRRAHGIGNKPRYMVAALSPIDIQVTGALPRRRRDGQLVNRTDKAKRLSPPVVLRRQMERPPVSDRATAALFLASLNSSERNDFAIADEKTKSGKLAARLAVATPSKISRGLVFRGETEAEFQSRQRRCLATAIYFEARGEPIQGQLAVAQVVMNRVRSETYPDTICGVVFQGQWRRRGCQFSFTCDGIADVPRNQTTWELAQRLAARVTDGKVWLAEVGHATHYHATYVRPRWRRQLNRIKKIGRHIFYRKPGADIQEADAATENPNRGLALAQSG